MYFYKQIKLNQIAQNDLKLWILEQKTQVFVVIIAVLYTGILNTEYLFNSMYVEK